MLNDANLCGDDENDTPIISIQVLVYLHRQIREMRRDKATRAMRGLHSVDGGVPVIFGPDEFN